MTSVELLGLIEKVINARAEYQYIEIKAAKKGCPERLYDTLSSFSNRDDGGIIIFGIDEQAGFERCGVYDLQDIQLKITEQCDAMIPKVRPLFSYAELGNGRWVCSIEVPAIDIAERPCFYSGKGRLKGSYVRVGTNDEPMTEYEIYSYEAYRKKYQDDIRVIPRVSASAIQSDQLEKYVSLLKENKPNLSSLEQDQIMELMSLKVGNGYTLLATLLFGLYPQAFFPQLCIIATAYPGESIEEIDDEAERFSDNERIEGTIQDILPHALAFVRRNTKTKTIIDYQSGKRTDLPEYPAIAVREVLINALVHRDYSIHTEGMPIQLRIFSNRIEVTNPGGLYGRISLDQLGKTQPDTRNPALATALEVLKMTENRYSGIPAIRRTMQEYGLPMPQFEDCRGVFKVTLWNKRTPENKNLVTEDDILSFCNVWRTRQEIADRLGIKSVAYAVKTYIMPLVIDKKIAVSNPDHLRSPNLKFKTNSN